MKIENSRLEGYIISTHTASQSQCEELCEQNKNCKSVNFKKYGLNNCELNSRIKAFAASDHFKRNDQWTYYQTNYTSKNVSFSIAVFFL